jgi:hypothetical protein
MNLPSRSFSAAALFITPDIFLKNCSRNNVNDLFQSRCIEKSNFFLISRLLFMNIQNIKAKIII